MRLLVLVLLASVAFAQKPLLWQRRQNTFVVEVGKKPMELELVSASTFSVRRGLPGPRRKPLADKDVECTATGVPGGLRLETADLLIEVSSTTGLLTASLPGGIKLLTESLWQLADGKARLEFAIPVTEKFYGFGPRSQESIDARGLAFETKVPSFISSRGYSFWIDAHGQYSFDIGKTRTDVLSIHADGLERMEYYFAFGPSVKEIWDQRWKAEGSPGAPEPAELELIRGSRLPKGSMPIVHSGRACEDARGLVHASLSGVQMPAFDLGRYRSTSDSTFRMAARMGVFAPILFDSMTSPLSEAQKKIVDEAVAQRKRFSHYLVVYADEVRSRGFPMIHPLVMQFPRDPAAASHIDAYMFGDEMLIVPFCEGVAKRDVYLPMGNWTDWAANRVYQGRRNVSLDAPADGVAILVKSGSVVPLNGPQATDPTELHYFPKNGGEFFIYEPTVAEYTQAHASPAADIYRLEIESKVDRKYEWVVHHIDKPKSVAQVGIENPYEESPQRGPLVNRTWRYDPSDRSVHIGVSAPARSDIIINLVY